MRQGNVPPTSSSYFEEEVSLVEILNLQTSDTSTVTSVSDSDSNQTLLSANTLRKMAVIHNDSSSILYIKFGATASSTDFTYRINPQGTLEIKNPVYRGRIDGIWSANSTGAALVTELT